MLCETASRGVISQINAPQLGHLILVLSLLISTHTNIIKSYDICQLL